MDYNLLEYRINKKNLSKKDLGNLLGISQSAFYRKMKGITEFDRNEIETLKNELDLTAEDVDRIFFNSEVS